MRTKMNRRSPSQNEGRVTKSVKCYFSVLLLIMGFYIGAQTTGTLKITIADKKTKEPIPFACAAIFSGTTQIGVATADKDGNCMLKVPAPMKYGVKIVYLGYDVLQINDVVVNEDRTTYLSPALSGKAVQLGEIVITEYKVPLIDGYSTSCGFSSYSCCSQCCCRACREIKISDDAFAKRKDVFYPNPSPGKITIESQDYMEEVLLFDLNGRLMDAFSIKDKKGEIDLSKYQNGTYVLRYPNEGKWSAGKVILVKE